MVTADWMMFRQNIAHEAKARLGTRIFTCDYSIQTLSNQVDEAFQKAKTHREIYLAG
jgi:hypothetical protein